MEIQKNKIEVNVNSVSLIFIAFIPYEKKKLDSKQFRSNFLNKGWYEKNQVYFDRIYYSNYLESVFVDKETTRHYELKLDSEDDLFQYQSEKIDITDFRYQIVGVEVILFSDEHAMTMLRVELMDPSIETIGKFTNYARTTLSSNKNADDSTILKIINKKVAGIICSNSEEWKSHNPNLKTASFIDIDRNLEVNELDRLLYAIGTFYNVNDSTNIFHPSDKYLIKKIRENSLDIYKNWKAIILQDSLSRISINLKSIDNHQLWEKQYIYVYMYVLYVKFLLQDTNEELLKISFERIKLKRYRKKFIDIINEFDLVKISYKFLENEIYDKIRSVLKIESELKKIENKISRQNVLYNEKYQWYVNTILLTLTIFTIISTIYDARQLINEFELTKDFSTGTLYFIEFGFFVTVICLALVIPKLYTRIKLFIQKNFNNK